LEGPVIDGRIILKWVLLKWDEGAWAGLAWLGTRRAFVNPVTNVRAYEMRGIS